MVSPGVRFIFMCVCFLWRAERAVWRWGGGRVTVTDDRLWAGIVCEPSAAKLSLCHPPQSSGNASYRCSMSSSADFSDEDDFSQKSGSASPAPGDTLPWNLPKHERSKRKIQGGSVLDPAERAVLRIAGKWGRGWRGDGEGIRVAEIHPSAPWCCICKLMRWGEICLRWGRKWPCLLPGALRLPALVTKLFGSAFWLDESIDSESKQIFTGTCAKLTVDAHWPSRQPESINTIDFLEDFAGSWRRPAFVFFLSLFSPPRALRYAGLTQVSWFLVPRMLSTTQQFEHFFF